QKHLSHTQNKRRAMSFNILCSLSYFLSLFPKGIIVGFLVREKGKLLMSMFRMSILPLVSSSVIAGLAGMDTKTTAKIGLRSMAYCLSSASTAILTVYLWANAAANCVQQCPTNSRGLKMTNLLLFLVLEGLLLGSVWSKETCPRFRPLPGIELRSLTCKASALTTELQDSTLCLVQEPLRKDFRIVLETSQSMNVLGLMAFCIVLGLIMSKMGKEAAPLISIFDSFNKVIMRVVTIVIYMPVGLFFLIASKIIEMDDWEIFKQLGLYITTVLGGHGGQNATLPVTFKSVEEKIGVSNTVSRVFLPLATTINLNGSALYQAVAVIFIARLFSPANSNVLIFSSSPNLTATVSSRAGSGVPSTGAVAMMTTLAAVGDRFRTMVTVLGDGIGAGIVDHLSIQDLK
uniref:Amino acid transporter n=1 Tax=Callorhinchus milii TaxID=7868 RepID=A0A4W3JWJ5_CALMI